MVCKDALLQQPVTKNHSINCIKHQECTREPSNGKVCPFRALALLLHRKEELERKNCNVFEFYPEKIEASDPGNFRGVCSKDNALVNDIVPKEFFLYNLDKMDSSTFGEIARKNIGK